MALTLSRRPGESVEIGLDGIVSVRIWKIERDRVYLSFDAPPDVPINRHELNERMKREGVQRSGLKVVGEDGQRRAA